MWEFCKKIWFYFYLPTVVFLLLLQSKTLFQFHLQIPMYYRNSAGALLVYDVTDDDSFRAVHQWEAGGLIMSINATRHN